MANMPSGHASVNVGLIGLGSDWETCYGPVFARLSDRIRIRAVYDAVSNRAVQAAADFRADVAEGMLALIQRADVQAVLILDTAWYGHQPLYFVCAKRKPAYLGAQVNVDLPTLMRLHNTASSAGQTVMPEFGHRYTPATTRLRELMATRIGLPHHINIEATSPRSKDENPGTEAVSHSALLTAMFDWCRYVVGTAPASVASQSAAEGENGSTGEQSFCVQFHHTRSADAGARAELRITHQQSSTAAGQDVPVRYEVHCDQGRAVLDGTSRITWSTNSAPVTETLTTERSALEVMFDHFCRRVVGGLIPVADIGDLCQNLKLIRAAEKSRTEGRPVLLNGSSE